jgi:hypothetical protein
MGINAPKTKPGVTGFVQEYNQEAPKTSDLNPDVVTEDSVLPPTAEQLPADKPRRQPKNGRRAKK